MKGLKDTYSLHFSDSGFVWSLIFAVILLFVSLYISFVAGVYATKVASQSVTDIVLSNIRVYDVDEIFIYGPVVFWCFAALFVFYKPSRLPFVLKSIALFVLIRSVFITLTHIGPFPTADVIPTTGLISNFAFGGDLFFSAHTGLPFLMALIFWDHKILRTIFIASAIFFGVVVLLGHLHYSIDVLSAFFITYSIYHISSKIFKKDKKYFEQTV